MNKDFRISTSIMRHPKTIKLIRRHGHEAFCNLISLWSYVAEWRPEGMFYDNEIEDIEIAANWQGEPGVFANALLELKFLDKTEEGYIIHDWSTHNAFATDAKARSEAASKAAKARWDNKLGRKKENDKAQKSCGSDADLCGAQCDSNTDAMQSHKNGNAPSPSPSPIPTPSKKQKCTDVHSSSEKSDNLSEPEKPPEKKPKEKSRAPCPHEKIIELWNTTMPELPQVKIWGKNAQVLLRARWNSDPVYQQISWWESFFQDIRGSDFLMGRTGNFQVNFEWVVRPTNFQKILNGNYRNRQDQRLDNNMQACMEFIHDKR